MLKNKFIFLLCFFILAAACSCGSSSSSSTPPPSDPPPSMMGGGSGPTPAAGTISYSGTFPTSISTGSAFDAMLTVSSVTRTMRIIRTEAGTNLPLLILFHGTNGTANGFLNEISEDEGERIRTFATNNHVIIVAPNAREQSSGDWDHTDAATYWTTTNDNANSNPDLLLVRAIIAEASTRFQINPNRIYVAGHSNGAFFAILTAMALRDQIAAFAENAGGLVPCATTTTCTATVTTTPRDASCASLASSCSACTNTNTEPVNIWTTGRKVPAFLSHHNDDDIVSPFYSCKLYSALFSASYDVSFSSLINGGGHSVNMDFLNAAWTFMSSKSLP